ncbi:MAG: acylphosphatase [Atopobiaceae bacterium]|nr:acylphosphatase [Atopobiaceae bacterium]
MVRKRVTFRGHVQGVGLRGTLSKYCLRRHVGGWMCNAPDSSLVVAELQGESQSVDAVLRSVAAFFSNPAKSRGMLIEVVGEVEPVDGAEQMHEVPWDGALCDWQLD